MFFVVSKIFVYLIYPLPVACLLLLGACWTWSKRPRLGRGLVISAMTLLWLLGTPVADLLLLPLETVYPAVVKPAPADAVPRVRSLMRKTTSISLVPSPTGL